MSKADGAHTKKKKNATSVQWKCPKKKLPIKKRVECGKKKKKMRIAAQLSTFTARPA